MDDLFARVLARLGFSSPPEPTFTSLTALYAAWCRNVPFDNVRKLIHVRAGNHGPFPGSDAADFLEAWLRHGTGGTCWAGNGAFATLLDHLGFDLQRGIGTMLAAPNIPPNHGTVRVRFGADSYLVDCSILHVEPLPLLEESESRIDHPAWGIRCHRREDKWHIAWRPLHKVDGFECRLEKFGVTAGEFHDRYEQTRGWSPFNYEVTARVNRGDEVRGVSFGHALTLHADGSVTRTPVDDSERRRILIEQVGFSEEIVRQLPPDLATPPPPGSQTAQAQAQAAASALA